MLALIGGFLVKLLGNGILTPILSYLQQKDVTQRDIAVAQIGAEQQRNQALVQAQIDANRYRGAQQTTFWPLVYLIALPPAIHAGAVYFDSMPLWLPFLGQHVVGSWGVALPPGDYAKMQTDVLTSFFYVAPAIAAAKVVGAALSKR